MARQLVLQTKSFDIDIAALQRPFYAEERASYVQAMALALHVEIDEALLEISWKPWASGIWFNREPYMMELIDCLHFLVNLMLIASTDPNEWYDLYLRKAEINAARQRDGYTGEKCPTCGRANDEEGHGD